MSGKETGYVYSKLVTVRGDGRTSGDSNTDFKYDLGNNMQRIWRVSVPSVVFRNNAYNVNGTGGGANNTFSIVSGTDEYDFEITPGWYTTTTLMTAVQDAINTQLTSLGDGQSVALSQDSLTQLVQVAYTAGAGPATLTLMDADFKTGIWELLGFEPPVTWSGTTVATYFPSLGGLTEVFLKSNTIAPGNMIDKGGSQQNTLVAIPVTVPFGALNVFECKVDELCQVSYMQPRTLQEVDFYLTDKNGNIIDLHGANLTINLKVWFNRF